MHSNKIRDEEIIIELILEQREEKIIIFKPCHQEERHRAIGKRESPDGIPG
jgi:ribosomal protein L21